MSKSALDDFCGTVSRYDIERIVEPCYCCGARLRSSDSKMSLPRSNFINLQAGARKEFKSEDGKREVVVVETSNGPLTIGMRYDW